MRDKNTINNTGERLYDEPSKKFEIAIKEILINLLEKVHKTIVYDSILFLSASGKWCFICGPNFEEQVEKHNGLFLIKLKDIEKNVDFVKLISRLEDKCLSIIEAYKNDDFLTDHLIDDNFSIYVNIEDLKYQRIQ